MKKITKIFKWDRWCLKSEDTEELLSAEEATAYSDALASQQDYNMPNSAEVAASAAAGPALKEPAAAAVPTELGTLQDILIQERNRRNYFRQRLLPTITE